MTPEQITVQACHACHHAGFRFLKSADVPNLVVCTVYNELELLDWLDKIKSKNIPIHQFREPDLDNSLTAVATAPMSNGQRKIFRPLPLLNFGGSAMSVNATFAMSPMVKSKYGFYPCTYELYKKLKRLNFLAYESVRRNAAWERWNRKLPHNRVIKRYDPACRGSGSRSKKMVVGPLPEPFCCAEFNDSYIQPIYVDYRKARYPVASPELVKPIQLSEVKIDELLVILEKWYAVKMS